MDVGMQLAKSHDIAIKIRQIYDKRSKVAQEKFSKRVQEGMHGDGNGSLFQQLTSLNPWSSFRYAVDVAQRSILFWDTLRQRGDNFVENTQNGLEPVLHFDYETVLDGRTFDRPVNYALLRIKPPAGIVIEPKRRPYIIIDPRAGHGPGIGGFKDDSQVGVALRGGHPVYFVIFFRDPEPGQTMLDVCIAEQQFVKRVRELHPESRKPALIGNCQGGWAAMMLGASSPDDTGPIVINGAPMSYWGGAWSEGEGDNPMRYSGGMLGGTWLASLTADLGNGKFDGAHLVQNFEGLNPANSMWDKYYNLYANIDTEPPRFLEFERWWGGYYLMNREEIEWITRNLFVGNKIWSGDVTMTNGKAFDLREIKTPIILFASLGDNITPPEQAFNWVADIYGSTAEIKARGQVIVGLMHQSIGHLGIFVSGKVAKKEHAQIVSVLQSVESLAPGLYGMEINESEGKDGEVEYKVEFREHRLEDISAFFDRFKRVDEKPFEAVATISEFNQRAYELFAQPMVQSMSNELSARLLREFHPLRFQNWALSSSVNPWMSWLAPAAQAVKASRKSTEGGQDAQPFEALAKSFNPWMSWFAPAMQAGNADRKGTDTGQPLQRLEKFGSEMISASLDYYRGMRDAGTEAGFFSIYANMFSPYLGEKLETDERAGKMPTDPRELPFVKEALTSIAEGGYTEACARVARLLTRSGEPLPLSRLALRGELADNYAEYLPEIPMDQWRRMRGEQEIIVRFEPDQALLTLPSLVAYRADRKRLLTLLDKVMVDERVQTAEPTDQQRAMLGRIHEVLSERAIRAVPLAAERSLS
jgi:pimeloyl-ACP methyl ester carboxylesterase